MDIVEVRKGEIWADTGMLYVTFNSEYLKVGKSRHPDSRLKKYVTPILEYVSKPLIGLNAKENALIAFTETILGPPIEGREYFTPSKYLFPRIKAFIVDLENEVITPEEFDYISNPGFSAFEDATTYEHLRWLRINKANIELQTYEKCLELVNAAVDGVERGVSTSEEALDAVGLMLRNFTTKKIGASDAS